MYYYDEENDMYKYNGNFFEFLKKIGVTEKHILDMQHKFLQKSHDRYYDFVNWDSVENNYEKIVPLDKCIGTSRGTVGWSVYDNVCKMYSGDREPGRFEDCFSYLEKMTMEELKKSYENLYNPVKMVYYVDEDKYFVSTDGNHRTLTAMLIGAQGIKAKVTNAYCNYELKRKFECWEEFKQQFSIYRVLQRGSRWDITFRDEMGYFEVRGYKGFEKENDFYLFIECLKEKIEIEMELAKKVGRYPAFLRQIILKIYKDNRIWYFIEKRYLEEEDLIFTNYRCEVRVRSL